MHSPTPRLAVDAIGGALVCACLAVGAWFAFGPPREAAAALRANREEVLQLADEVSQMRSALLAAQARLQATRDRVQSLGALPRQMQLEQDLNTIAELARARDLSLSHVAPVATTDYPGVRETRYTIRGTGRFADWMAFLQAFEASPFWADITNLDMGAPQASRAAADAAPEATLTVSFYVATEPTGPPAEESAKK